MSVMSKLLFCLRSLTLFTILLCTAVFVCGQTVQAADVTLTLKSGEHGRFVDASGNPITSVKVASGGSITLQLQADAGYSVHTVTLNNTTQKIGGDYKLKLTNVTSSQTVSATFSDFPTIFIDMDDGGEIGVNGKDVTYEQNIKDKVEYRTCQIRIDQNSCTPQGSVSTIRNNVACQIRGRGNSTWSLGLQYGKKPYRLKFAVNDMKSPFNMGAARDWCLLANWIDKTHLHNALAYEIGRKMEVPFTHEAQHVRLIFNGRYDGLYLLTELSEVGPTRVDINEITDRNVNKGITDWMAEFDAYEDEYIKMSPKYNLPTKFKQPVIMGEKQRLEEYISVDPTINDPYNPRPIYNCWKAATEQISQFETDLKNNLSQLGRPDLAYEDNINTPTFIDWVLVHAIAGNYEPRHPKSSYFHVNTKKNSTEQRYNNGKITGGVLWDFDWAWGYQNETGSEGTFETIKSFLWFGDLFKFPKFQNDAKKRWAAVKAQLFDSNYVYDYIDAQAAFIRAEAVADLSRWNRSSTFDAEIASFKTWIRTNVSNVNNGFNAMTPTKATLSYQKVAGGSIAGPSSSVLGDVFDVAIIADTGYRLTGLAAGGTAVKLTGDTTYTIRAQKSPMRMTPTFRPEYQLIIINGGKTQTQACISGERVRLVAEAWVEGDFLYWSYADTVYSTETMCLFTMPDTDAVIEVVYSRVPTYKLTVNGGTGSALYRPGTLVSIRAQVPEGESFDKWVGDCAWLQSAPTQAENQFIMPTCNLELTAQTCKGYLLTLESKGETTARYCAPGEKVTLHFASDDQWVYQYLSDAETGKICTYSPSYTLVMPKKARALRAVYAPRTESDRSALHLKLQLTNENVLLSWNAQDTAKRYEIYCRDEIRFPGKGFCRIDAVSENAYADPITLLVPDSLRTERLYYVKAVPSNAPSETVAVALPTHYQDVLSLNCGCVSTIHAAALLLDSPIEKFDRPAVSAYYFEPFKADKIKKLALSVDQESFGTPELRIFNKKDVPLYDAKVYNKRVQFSSSSAFLNDPENGLRSSIPMGISIRKPDAAHPNDYAALVYAAFERMKIETVFLDGDTVLNRAESDALVISLNSTRDRELTVRGRYFGVKTPKCYLEYAVKGKIKKTALKVSPIISKASPLTKSFITRENGESACKISVPTRQWRTLKAKGSLPMYECFVLTGGKNFDALNLVIE